MAIARAASRPVVERPEAGRGIVERRLGRERQRRPPSRPARERAGRVSRTRRTVRSSCHSGRGREMHSGAMIGPVTEPDDPPRRPRRLLRVGGAARQAGTARAAGDRRRRRRRGCARRGLGRQLRGPRVWRALRDVAARGVPALSARRVPAGQRPSLPGGEPRRDGDPPTVHAAGRTDLDRRSLPRRDRFRGAVRRRAHRSPG